MPIEFIDLNSPHVVPVNCDNRKAMGKEKRHGTKFEKSTKNDNRQFRKKKMAKWKSNLKSMKGQNVNSYYGKNWKVITINLIIITVIIEIIVKMTVILMNNNYNNNNKIFLSKETNIDIE